MDEKLTRIARRGCKRGARSPTRSLAAAKDERDKREEEKKRERERERELAISSLLFSSLLFCRTFLCTICSIPFASLFTNYYTEIHSLFAVFIFFGFSFPLGFAAIATEHAS